MIDKPYFRTFFFQQNIQHVTFLLPFFIFAQFTIRQSKRLNFATTYVFAKFERFDWRIVNCAKIKNGSKNVTPCIILTLYYVWIRGVRLRCSMAHTVWVE